MNSGGEQPTSARGDMASEGAIPDLSPAAWDARYAATDIPWDMGEVSPPLVCFRQEGILPVGRQVLVPGCGSGYEVAYLAEAGYEAVGADFSSQAVAAARRIAGTVPNARIIQADLLAPAAVSLGEFDWIFDQTFFCAIAPVRRPEYAIAMGRLLRPGGELWALSFRVASPGGPPFDSTPADFIELMSSVGFELIQQRPLTGESHPARRGRETLIRMRRG